MCDGTARLVAARACCMLRSPGSPQQRPRRERPGVTLVRWLKSLHRRHKERQFSNAWDPAVGLKGGLEAICARVPLGPVSIFRCQKVQENKLGGSCWSCLCHLAARTLRSLGDAQPTSRTKRCINACGCREKRGYCQRGSCQRLSRQPNHVRRRCPGKLPKIKHLQHTRGTPHYKG